MLFVNSEFNTYLPKVWKILDKKYIKYYFLRIMDIDKFLRFNHPHIVDYYIYLFEKIKYFYSYFNFLFLM